MLKRHLLLILSAAVLFAATACNLMEPYDPDDDTDILYTYGAYFLNAGHPGGNDAELSQLNTVLNYVNPNVYSMRNGGKALGDDARDLQIVGSKLYVTLAGSREIRVLNKFDSQDLGSITIRSEEDGSILTPNYMASYEGTLIVSLEEGYLARIDTLSLKPEVIQAVNGTPRQIAFAGQKLYVANYRDGEEAGHTLQMLNPVDLHIMKTVEVVPGPAVLETDPATGDLYLISEGDGQTESALQRIDKDTDEVTLVKSVSRPLMMAAGPQSYLVLFVQESDEKAGRFIVFDTKLQNPTADFIIDGTYISRPCMLSIDQNTGIVYIGENTGDTFGTVHIFTSYGQYITGFNTGAANPCRAAFVTGN